MRSFALPIVLLFTTIPALLAKMNNFSGGIVNEQISFYYTAQFSE